MSFAAGPRFRSSDRPNDVAFFNDSPSPGPNVKWPAQPARRGGRSRSELKSDPAVLFYMNKNVVALMNSTAPEFFVLLQELLAHNILLCIPRLTDKHEVGRRENLRLSRLVVELRTKALDWMTSVRKSRS
jgi:hypothetical protein